ncbi:MAG: NTE family protein [Saliniramus fredricksonii]|uniref:NTE family protein n=1 Tax=Saliniramus fredricksonii TaxID=1653334 RepID=A0A0P7YCS8_9HYPH|nr:patatin-like phospholipase family protein [Saliniramus fredricksonii]KPQ11948.1 MAG: NTE family protein [Saliniramus fredricksonii]SCC81556.1 NTE family protein [Saliniramus fredricksonii]
MDASHHGLKIGIALGGGAARGWSHIGVLRVLAEEGIVPDMVAGTSIGAVVGGCLAAGKLDDLEEFARSLTRARVLGLLDFSLGASGLIAGEKLRQLLQEDLGGLRIEELPMRFGAIATEITTGHEIWLTRGRLLRAVQASYALPGIINPVRIGNRLLVDGTLVNPVPVSAARALGADVVLCVNLNGDLKLRGTTIQSIEDAYDDTEAETPEAEEENGRPGFLGPMLDMADNVADSLRGRDPARRVAPGMAKVMLDAFNITQDRISRARLAGDPPDLMISPKLAKIGLFDFHRADEIIALGAQATRRAMPDIRELLAEAKALAAAMR